MVSRSSETHEDSINTTAPGLLLRLLSAAAGAQVTHGMLSLWIISRAGRILSLLTPLVIARWFGATADTDVVFFVFATALYLASLFGPILERIIAPYLRQARAEGTDTGPFLGHVLGVSSVTIGVALFVALLIGHPFFNFFTGFDREQVSLAYRLLLILGPLSMLVVWSSAIAGTLRAYDHQRAAALSPALSALVTWIATFALRDSLGIYAIACGYLLGELLRLSVLLASLLKSQVCSLALTLKPDARIRRFLQDAFYVAVGSAAVGLNPLVDKAMASWLSPGDVSILHYADALYMIPVVLLTGRIIVSAYSPWQRRLQERGVERFRRDVESRLWLIAIFTGVCCLGLLIVHRPVLWLAMDWGLLTRETANVVSLVWICYTIGLVPAVMERTLVQAHQVLHSFPIFMTMGTVNFVLNVMLNLALMRQFGLYGIALSTSCISTLVTILLWRSFRKRCAERVRRGDH